ncbi:MAG: hypothetical protein ABI923_03850, partial [bacterium]
MPGAFIVSRDNEDSRDIRFSLLEDAGPAPEEQLALKAEIESVLTILRMLFSGQKDFDVYFRPLLSLSQAGLVGQHAQPKVAAGALEALKNEITAREGGKIKNRYMQALGLRAMYIGGPALLLGVIFYAARLRWPINNQTVDTINNFLFLWSGCMAGVWLSFGARKTFLRFEDLHIPEEDRLEPTIRLIFAGLLTVIVGLFFSLRVLTVNFGMITTDQINVSVRLALLIGFLGGFSEKALSSAVARQASRLLAS